MRVVFPTVKPTQILEQSELQLKGYRKLVQCEHVFQDITGKTNCLTDHYLNWKPILQLREPRSVLSLF